MSKKISILGLGWLGFPLAEKLVAKNYHVKGSVTSASKLNDPNQTNIEVFQIKLSETTIEGKIEDFLSFAEILIIAIPPGLRKNPNKNYVNEIKLLQQEIIKAKVPKVLYISSTAVFKDETNLPLYTEKTPANETSLKAKQLIEVEDSLKHTREFSTTIVRFGGLIGKDRHPIHFLSERKNIANPKAPVNLIHLEDAIAVILKVIETESWEGIFHGVFPTHSTKETYYIEVAKHLAVSLPEFNYDKPSKGKIISSEETVKKLGLSFKCKP